MSTTRYPSFTVALVGRPNVGKSTFFNRLVGKRLAIVDDTPGVTRDRREGEGKIGDLRFRVLDTAGLEDVTDDSLEGRMRRQTEAAIESADIALLMIDARAGVMPLDSHFAALLRKGRTPVVLIANKCEGRAGEAGLIEAYSLGLGEPVPVSAEHGEGMSDLYTTIRDAMTAKDEAHAAARNAAARNAAARNAGKAEAAFTEELLPAELDIELEGDGEEEGEAADSPRLTGPMQLAIVGRPNVGKSTLINRLVEEDRLLTGPEAGITRDSIAIDWQWKGRDLKLVDTAGLRKRARVYEKVEKLSAADTRRAVDFAHVVVLLLDANDMLEKQDLTIARQVIEEGRALVIAANKWDSVKDKAEQLQKLRDRLQTSLAQVRGVPVVTISALEGRNLDKLIGECFRIFDIWNSRVSTSKLNDWLHAMTEAHPPPIAKGRRVKLRFVTQARTRPPTFAVFASQAAQLPDSYQRYLINGLRDDFGLDGVPLRLSFRQGKNPFAPRRK